MPRGDYDAHVMDSSLVDFPEQATLTLWLTCKNKHRMCETGLPFVIRGRQVRADERPYRGWLCREELFNLASVLEVDQLEDSEQLHGKRFKLTVWDGWSMRFSFRPAA